MLTDRMPGVRSVTLGFFFRVGSRQEPLELNGISHFIEHTVFKGTGSRSALEIAREQDRLGGNLDAFTSHEETGFAIKVIDSEFDAAFALLSDLVLNPRFDEADLESEQRVIIEEMKMIEDAPEDYLGEIFAEAFFPAHPLGMSIAGTPATVRSFDREKTSAYHRDVFNRSNLVIAAAGNVEHDKIEELMNSCGLLDNSDRGKAETLEPNFAAPILLKDDDRLEQAHLLPRASR